jgi:hypothetical protein
MKHLYGLADILSVEIPDELADANEENERLDVKVTFRFHADVDGAGIVDANEFKDDVDADLLAFAQEETARTDFSYLWDCTKHGYKVGKDDEKALKEMKEKLEKKTLPFTVYVFQIDELLKGTKYTDVDGKPYRNVQNEKRTFSSFSNSYLLKYDDADAVFSAMQARLLRDLKSKDLLVGRTDEEADEFAKRQKELRKKERDDD